MNKRIILNLITFVILISFQIPVFAAVRQTEIRIKPGEKSMKINLHSISAKDSFYRKGSLMVPLRAIADLIGASLENSTDLKTVTAFRNNKNIKFVIDKNLAFIDGIKKEIPCAPVVENGTTMVPLRILADAFNAVISKDSSTGEIVTIFPFSNYQNRFAYLKEGKVGDLYYGWSVLFPKGCVLDDKKPSGSSILVKNIGEGYYYYIFNTIARAGMKEENLLDELESYVDDEKIIQKNLVIENGRKCGLLVLESQDEIYEYKAILKNGRLYQIHFYTVDKSGFFDEKKGKINQDIIKSFNADYSVNSPEVVNISEINNGMYTYRESSCGWEFDVPAEVNLEVKNSDYSFEIFDEKGKGNGLTVGVDISAANQGENLESYSTDEINAVFEEINKECVSELVEKNAEISGKNAKKIYYKINAGSKCVYFFNALIIDKQSKFHIYVYGESRFFQSENVDLGDRIIQSFMLPEKPIKPAIITEKN